VQAGIEAVARFVGRIETRVLAMPGGVALWKGLLHFTKNEDPFADPNDPCFVEVVKYKPVVIVDAVDPNAKTGPAGTGLARYVIGNEAMPYVIMFENEATATAPAHIVTIRDSLELSALDPGTIRALTVTLPDTMITVVGNSGVFRTDVDLRPAKNLIVRINGTVDPVSGFALVEMISIDPATMLPSDDPAAGFLPPNVTPPQGEGSIAFVVAPREGLNTGTTVANTATITFDANAPIDTQFWQNRIDSTAPQSEVAALPSHMDASRFGIAWSGSDAGSGIMDFTVYSKRDSGAYEVWRFQTAATADTFTADSSGTYSFFSVARDSAGNSEAIPQVADASTTYGNVTAVSPMASKYAFRMWPAQPNPVWLQTTIRFELRESRSVKLFVFDVAGRRVKRLVDGEMLAGLHQVNWGGRDETGRMLPGGVYFVWLESGGFRITRRVVLVR